MENISKDHQKLVLQNQIISAILNAKNTNHGIQLYRQCLEKDFRDFAKDKGSLQQGAEALLKLQEIQKELELIASYPALYKKTIVAVGGGFSAGKSEFISSFFQEGEGKLAIGMEPMTAIPTYVINGEKTRLIGCTNNSASVNLSEIDPQIQSKMSHDFIKSFDFNLRNIMPFAVLETKLKDYQNICFIDTPGYNPPEVSDGYTGEDIKTAEDFLNNAEILFWLIGLDANGTISRSDLNFLKGLELENKRLYIIINKADLKTPSAVKEIIEEVSSTLDLEDIAFEGISAYSSSKKKEIDYLNISLLDFLNQINVKSTFQENILKELYAVRSMYRYAILKKNKEQKSIFRALKSLSLDLYEEEVSESHPMFQRVEKLKNYFSSTKSQENLKAFDKVIENFKSAINEVFSNPLEVNFQEIDESDIILDPECNFYPDGENPEGIKKYDLGIKCLEERNFSQAITFLEEAIELGDIKACLKLGDIYHQKTTTMVTLDLNKAKELYELAIERGSVEAYCSLGNMYRDGNGVPQDYKKAKELYELAIKRGNALACKSLGNMYRDGNGVPQDYNKAEELYKLAIEKGSVEAYCSLGDMYRDGNGVSQDYKKAKELYKLAIKRGNALACKSLGDMYHDGNGVSQDYNKAKELYKLAIKRGSVEAYCSLGDMYHDGNGVSQDYKKAKELYKLAIKRGSVEAYCSLGDMYHDGNGVPQDYKKAKELYELGIKNGDDMACYNLGKMYYEIKHLDVDSFMSSTLQQIKPTRQVNPKSKIKAKKLYELAIKRGNALACKSLGDMYYHGDGVPADRNKARELYELGASRGDQDCKNALRVFLNFDFYHSLGKFFQKTF